MATGHVFTGPHDSTPTHHQVGYQHCNARHVLPDRGTDRKAGPPLRQPSRRPTICRKVTVKDIAIKMTGSHRQRKDRKSLNCTEAFSRMHLLFCRPLGRSPSDLFHRCGLYATTRFRHEKNLPAQRSEAQAHTRLSRPNGHPRRTRPDQPPSCQRPQAPLGLTPR